MLFLIPAIAAMSGSPHANRPLIPPLPARCEEAARLAAADRTFRGGKLGDMPPAQAIKAVRRFDENGCPVMVKVRRSGGGIR